MVKLPTKETCLNCKEKSGIRKYLSDDEFNEILKNRILVRYREGETIIKQNSRATQAFFIHGGIVKIYIEGLDDKNIVVRYGKRPDFIGFSSFYTNHQYSFTVTAMEDTVVCFVDFTVIKNFIDNNKQFAFALNKSMVNDGKLLGQRLVSIAHKQAPGRVAEAILYLYNEVYNQKEIIPATRTDIAEICSLSKDGAGRVLKDFTGEKLIENSGKSIKILNEQKLIELVSLG